MTEEIELPNKIAEDRVVEKKTDSRGRLNLGSEYAHERVRVAILSRPSEAGIEEIDETDGNVVVRATDSQGVEHDLPFSKETEVVGHGDAELDYVYVHAGNIHGHYVGEDDQEFEATLWHDGQPYNEFKEFDFGDEYGSVEAKADEILWEK